MVDHEPADDRIRELVIDTMASWALDGLYPTKAILRDIEANLNGELSDEEILERARNGGFYDES